MFLIYEAYLYGTVEEFAMFTLIQGSPERMQHLVHLILPTTRPYGVCVDGISVRHIDLQFISSTHAEGLGCAKLQYYPTYFITNFKEIRDLIKIISEYMRRKYLFQQQDTKINNFDEGVLILEPLFWGNVIFKFASFVSKVTIEVGRNFFECLPRIVTLQSYVMNASLYSSCLRFSKQEQTLYPG